MSKALMQHFASAFLLIGGLLLAESVLAQQVTGQDVDKILERADKLLDESKAAYESARQSNSVSGFVDAGFKLEEARIKYIVVQEVGSPENQKAASDRLRSVNQLNKLIHDGRVAISGNPAEDPSSKGTDAPRVAPPPTVKPEELPAAVDVSKRAPIPEPTKQKEAEKQVRDLFKEQYSKKAPADRKALAKLLIGQAVKTQNDPAGAWVLYREAQDIAVQVGDPTTAIEAVDLMARSFDVDALSMKGAILSATGKILKTPEEFGSIVDLLLRQIDELIAVDQYDLAEKTAASASQSARKSADAGLIAIAAIRVKEVAEAKTLYQGMKGVLSTLAKNPDDQAANSEMGKFLCYVKGSWDLGLRFLAKGSDATLKALAEKELAIAGDRVALADSWYELGEKEKSPLRKSQLSAHAKRMYEIALPDSSGLVRARIEKRLSDITTGADPAAKKGAIGFRPEQLKQFVNSGGTWKIEGGELVGMCPGDAQWATYTTSYSVITSVTIRARIISPSTKELRLWVGSMHMIFNWEGADENHYRLGGALTKTKPGALTPGKEVEIALKVQGARVILTVDGKKQVEMDGALSGAISFQGAHGNTVGIRQLTVEGTPDAKRVTVAPNRSLP